MVDKLEVGKLYRWGENIYFITRIYIDSDRMEYYQLGSNPPQMYYSPYNAARRLLEDVS